MKGEVGEYKKLRGFYKRRGFKKRTIRELILLYQRVKKEIQINDK